MAKRGTRKVTTTYSGEVTLAGEGKPTISELYELLDTAVIAGADMSTALDGVVESARVSGVYDPITIPARTNLSIAVPAGPVCGGN